MTKPAASGRPLDNLTVRIQNEHGEELPQGQTGEIWVERPIDLRRLSE